MNYIVSDTDLTSIANSIRGKTGGTGQLQFPSGFTSDIDGLISLNDLKLVNITTRASDTGYSVSATLNEGETRILGNVSVSVPITALKLQSGAFDSRLYSFETPTVTGLTVTVSDGGAYEYFVSHHLLEGTTMGMTASIRCTQGQITVSGRAELTIGLICKKPASS